MVVREIGDGEEMDIGDVREVTVGFGSWRWNVSLAVEREESD